MQELDQQTKKALKELSASNRVCAYALKKISDKIQKIYEAQKKDIDANHQSFLSDFKKVEDKASQIIVGCELKDEDMGNIENYVKGQEKASASTIMKSKKPIEKYWLTSLLNSQIGEMISKTDQEALASLRSIESNITFDTIEIIMSFEESEWIKGGKYQRSVKLSEIGAPQSFQGDQITLKKYATNDDREMGLILSLGKDTKDPKQLFLVFETITFMTNQLIPYSLNYYLGAIDQEEIDFPEDEQEDEDDDEQEEEPNKKRKKE